MASALVGAVVGGVAFKAGATWFGTNMIASVLTGAALGHSLFGPRRSRDLKFEEDKFNTWSENLPIPVIYGKTRAFGNVIYKRVSSDSKRLYLAVAIGEGELTSITDIRADEELLGDLDGYVRSEVRLGTPNQTPVTWLFSSGEPQERWKNTAYIALEFEVSIDVWSSPNISAIVEGRKIGVLNSQGQWSVQYSRNPIWCLYDLLTNTRFGVGIKPDSIDVLSFREAAEYCDQLVDGEVRFRFDGIFDTAQSSLDLIDSILATCRGFLVYSEGKLRVQIEKDEIPVQAFMPENIIKDSFSFQQVSKNQIPNQVVVEWLDPEIDWRPTSTEWNNEVDQDERGLHSLEVSLPGITRASQAGRMARFILDKHTQCRTICQFGVGIDALQCEVGDIIKVSHFVPGWHEKLFRIIQLEENENDEMTIVAQEHSKYIYHDRGVASQPRYTPPAPNPIIPPAVPTNIKASAVKVGGQTVIGVEWDPVSHPFGVYYEISYRPGSVASWNTLVVTTTSATIANLSAGEETYVIQLRAVSNNGQQGWSSDPIAIDLRNPHLLPMRTLLPADNLYPA
jgi:predicted phage tail protein